MASLHRRVRRSTVGRARWRSIVLAGVAALDGGNRLLVEPRQLDWVHLERLDLELTRRAARARGRRSAR